MARFKHIDTSLRLLPVMLEQQLIPGTFEHALHHLLDSEIDHSRLNARYRCCSMSSCLVMGAAWSAAGLCRAC